MSFSVCRKELFASAVMTLMKCVGINRMEKQETPSFSPGLIVYSPYLLYNQFLIKNHYSCFSHLVMKEKCKFNLYFSCSFICSGERNREHFHSPCPGEESSIPALGVEMIMEVPKVICVSFS